MYKMKMKIQKRFKGYITFPRSFSWFFIENSMNFGLLGDYISFVAQADWDQRRSTYGFLPPNHLLARIWKVNESTVSRKRKKLIQMGLVVREKGDYKVKHIDFFKPTLTNKIARCEFTNREDFIAEIERLFAELKEMGADSQNDQVQKDAQSFKDSFKNDLSLSYEQLDIDSIDKFFSSDDDSENKK